MRICLLSKEYPPDTGWGGIGTYNYQIAHGLKEIGHDVEIIALAKSETLHPSKVDFIKPVIRTNSMEDGIIVHRVPWASRMEKHSSLLITAPASHFMLKTNIPLWNKLLEIHSIRPFDVVETPEHLAEGLMPAITKWLPLVIKLHTPYSKFIAEKFHNTTAAFDHQLIAMLERFAMLSADVLISPSRDLITYLSKDMNYPAEEIKIVKNPIDANKFVPDGPAAMSVDGQLTVLFVGRLEERKGIYYLAEAIPHILKNIARDHLTVRFIIVGSDTTTAAERKSVYLQLKEMLAKSDSANHVTFIPHVALDDMPAYYRSADICIAPSLYDNAPYTCLEAMSCGRPVIGTSAGGTSEYIVDGVSGLIIPPGDTAAIVNAITRLLKSADERRRFGHNARNYILENVHRTQVARQNEEIYKLAIKRFVQKKEKSISCYSPAQSLAQTNRLLYAYQTTLYNMLYAHSLRFRIGHSLKLLVFRPRLGLAKIIVRLSPTIFGSRIFQLPFLAKLKEQIIAKEHDKERLVSLELGCSK